MQLNRTELAGNALSNRSDDVGHPTRQQRPEMEDILRLITRLHNATEARYLLTLTFS
jgi:hypothetical protein